MGYGFFQTILGSMLLERAKHMTHSNASSLHRLEELQREMEQVWHELIHCRNATQRSQLRERYRAAVREVQRQKAFVVEIPATPPVLAAGERPDPFHFLDYREFLVAWLRYLAQIKKVSVRDFAERCDIPSAQLVKALKRTRPITQDMNRKILKHLGVTSVEESFLEALFTVSETDDVAMRFAALKRLLSFSSFRKANPAEFEVWHYLSHWYYVAIREMATLGGFRAEAHWIQKRLRKQVPLEEIRKALVFLEGAGFFSILSDGSVFPRMKEMVCQGGVFRLALGRFHHQILELVQDSIVRVPSDRRIILGHTMALPGEKMAQVRAIFDEALQKISELEQGEVSTEDVYHFEFAAVPLSRGSEVEKG